MALGALGAVAVLDVGSTTAEAAPSVSPYAGTYDLFWWPAAITISDGGQITSSYSGPGSGEKGSISGRVRADGSYSFAGTMTVHDDDTNHGHVWNGVNVTSRFKEAGTMETDDDGNVILTADTGGSAIWLRR